MFFYKKKFSFVLKRIPLYFLWLVSFIFPRSKKKWCFGSQIAYAGSNSKYLLFDVLEQFPDVEAAWITDDKNTYNLLKQCGIPVYMKWSMDGLWFTLTAKVYFYTHGPGDINFSTSGGTFKINLWHGVGIKKCEYLAHLSWVNKNSLVHKIIYPYFCVNHDRILNTSKILEEYLSKVFRQSPSSFIYSYVPRSRTAFFAEEKRFKILNSTDINLLPYITKIKKCNRTFCYMPTYRSNKNVLELCGFDYDSLNEVLKKNNDLMLIKLHPNDLKSVDKIPDYSNIVIIHDQIDLYLLFPYVHTLITDYSSIYAEFLLFRNSVIIFDFDYVDFEKNDSGLWFDFKEFTSGLHARSFEELLCMIDTKSEYPIPDYNGMIAKYWGDCGDYSLPKVVFDLVNNL